jgi:hypothetical protein
MLVDLVLGQWPASCLNPPCQPLIIKKPEYYRLDTSSCGRDDSASVHRDERQISYIASKSLRSSYEKLKNEEALAKDTTSGYCKMALHGILESLQRRNIESLKRLHNCVLLFMWDCVMPLSSHVN